MDIFTLIEEIDDVILKSKRCDDVYERYYYFCTDLTRDYFDSGLDLNQWEQLDTQNDAFYFGIWFNKKDYQTLYYAKRSIILRCYKEFETFKKTLVSELAHFGAAPYKQCIDLDKKILIKYYRHYFFQDQFKAL